MYLLTRPAPKLQTSTAAFRAAGLAVTGVAPLDIRFDSEVIEQLRQTLAASNVDTLIVTSTFAAEALLTLSLRVETSPTLIAVGSSTAALLRTAGHMVTVPASQDSEGVLETAQLKQAKGQTLVIIKGREGRTLIADSLRAGGNTVVEMPVYFRKMLPSPVTTNDWQWPDVKGIITTSAEMAQSMFDSYPAAPLLNIPWLAVSNRVADTVKANGVARVGVCQGASDTALIHWVKENWE
ncbi:uroporphyrinogen-III synthase [Alteromonas aestuariivivens]|uniref:Uroporphyrinogen-III synthase n=1 Tax=Alteromonas aestuariivivens TaxID=1938339 RepID=A0A3D8M7B9_9ALTE|nr:uroporphyrinogen-III synthase [Alteromonas aestuariivivens]RDV25479.1 uroporphyrinogen-III synthase [Alteromonas aestuariivivens]